MKSSINVEYFRKIPLMRILYIISLATYVSTRGKNNEVAVALLVSLILLSILRYNRNPMVMFFAMILNMITIALGLALLNLEKDDIVWLIIFASFVVYSLVVFVYDGSRYMFTSLHAAMAEGAEQLTHVVVESAKLIKNTAVVAKDQVYHVLLVVIMVMVQFLQSTLRLVNINVKLLPKHNVHRRLH